MIVFVEFLFCIVLSYLYLCKQYEEVIEDFSWFIILEHSIGGV